MFHVSWLVCMYSLKVLPYCSLFFGGGGPSLYRRIDSIYMLIFFPDFAEREE